MTSTENSDIATTDTPRQLRPPRHRLERKVIALWIVHALDVAADLGGGSSPTTRT